MSTLSILAIIFGSMFGLILLLYMGSRVVTSAYFRSKKEFLKSHLFSEKEQEDE